jgi:hypothetical protein
MVTICQMTLHRIGRAALPHVETICRHLSDPTGPYAWMTDAERAEALAACADLRAVLEAGPDRNAELDAIRRQMRGTRPT